MKVLEYKIVTEYGAGLESTARRLNDVVNSYIACGWLPRGGVSFQKDGNTYMMTQAMTKEIT